VKPAYFASCAPSGAKVVAQTVVQALLSIVVKLS
ncbi:MAG: hypothetical protein ACI9RY_001207, partial [Reinekea sp.]